MRLRLVRITAPDAERFQSDVGALRARLAGIDEAVLEDDAKLSKSELSVFLNAPNDADIRSIQEKLSPLGQFETWSQTVVEYDVGTGEEREVFFLYAPTEIAAADDDAPASGVAGDEVSAADEVTEEEVASTEAETSEIPVNEADGTDDGGDVFAEAEPLNVDEPVDVEDEPSIDDSLEDDGLMGGEFADGSDSVLDDGDAPLDGDTMPSSEEIISSIEAEESGDEYVVDDSLLGDEELFEGSEYEAVDEPEDSVSNDVAYDDATEVETEPVPDGANADNMVQVTDDFVQGIASSAIDEFASSSDLDAADGELGNEPLFEGSAFRGSSDPIDIADIGEDERAMVDYISTLELNQDILTQFILPVFTQTETTEAVGKSVATDVIAPSREELLALAPAFGRVTADEEDPEFFEIDYENESDNSARIEYFEETQRLLNQYTNDRAIVRDMSDEKFMEVQSDAINLITAIEPKRLAKLDDARAEMFDSIQSIQDTIAATRADYADQMREAMGAAAVQAANDFAAAHKSGVIMACDDVMMTGTNDVAKQLSVHSMRAYEALIYAERKIENPDEAAAILGKDVDTAALRAYLSASRYRILADRSVAKMAAAVTTPVEPLRNPSQVEFSPAMGQVAARVETNADSKVGGGGGTVPSAVNVETSDVDRISAMVNGDVPLDEPEDAAGATTSIPIPVPASTSATSSQSADDSDLAALMGGMFDGGQTTAGAGADAFSGENVASDVIDFAGDSDFFEGTAKPMTLDFDDEESAIANVNGDSGEAPRKKLSLPKKILIGVASAALVGALGLGAFSLFGGGLGGGNTSEEATVERVDVDPYGRYALGEQYRVNIQDEDGNIVETTVSISGFFDSTDDSQDCIVVVDADGTERTITYDKMAQIDGTGVAANSSSTSASSGSDESGQNSTADGAASSETNDSASSESSSDASTSSADAAQGGSGQSSQATDSESGNAAESSEAASSADNATVDGGDGASAANAESSEDGAANGTQTSSTGN